MLHGQREASHIAPRTLGSLASMSHPCASRPYPLSRSTPCFVCTRTATIATALSKGDPPNQDPTLVQHPWGVAGEENLSRWQHWPQRRDCATRGAVCLQGVMNLLRENTVQGAEGRDDGKCAPTSRAARLALGRSTLRPERAIICDVRAIPGEVLATERGAATPGGFLVQLG